MVEISDVGRNRFDVDENKLCVKMKNVMIKFGNYNIL